MIAAAYGEALIEMPICGAERTSANLARRGSGNGAKGTRKAPDRASHFAAFIACAAYQALLLEVDTWPKPGLVSHVDAGSHHDMKAATFYASARSLRGYFERIADRGAKRASIAVLRSLGIDAEHAMLHATGGVNTHRGAIFGMGLLCAAAGFRYAAGRSDDLGAIVAERWGDAITSAPLATSHGARVQRRYGVGGARAEAASGFPSVYRTALPALRAARVIRAYDSEAQRVHVLFALLAHVEDTNLLHRGGLDGARWARGEAHRFMAAGGIAAPDWRQRAAAIHRDFVIRRLSPGGCADLLAMCLFVDALDRASFCYGV